MKLSVEQAVALLLEGNVVAVPTETVYGLAAIATMPLAIAQVFEIKNRPAVNPLICHFYSIEQIEPYVEQIPEPTRKLMEQFTPGPVSFMLDLPEDSPLKFATCGRDQVIVRIPNHPLFLSIIKKADQPVAAPSANTSGKISPTSAHMVEEDLGSKIAGVVDGGGSDVGLESTILDARSEKEIFILRPGIIGEKEIHKILPQAQIIYIHSTDEATVPGAKYRHYAPGIRVFLIDSIPEIRGEQQVALMMVKEEFEKMDKGLLSDLSARNVHLLSLGSLKYLNELAKNFYKTLATLNHLPISKAFFLKTDFGDTSLGKALQNRLERIVERYK